jgi:hypothetical protein
MTNSEFEAILDAQLFRVATILAVKTDEYATKKDQLANIRASADLQDTTMRNAVAGMMSKHTCSIYAMARDRNTYTRELWDEKITDHIIWLILLRAVIEEDSARKEH